MHSVRQVLRSVLHYRRAHIGLLLGTVLAAAILTGALIVGDSVNHTLRTYALQRLGKAELAITPGDRLFATRLSTALHEKLDAPVATVLALPGMAIHQDVESGARTQVNKVQALGVDDAFWTMGNKNDTPLTLSGREAALNARLADALGVAVGDTVALRIAKPGLLSRDAPLSSREEEASARANFKVKFIASDAQMGRFGLAANQIPPYNFFVGIDDLQQLADTGAQANLMLVGALATEDATIAALNAVWVPADAGLSVVARSGGVLQLETNRIFIDAATAEAAMRMPGAQGALTYLVNGLESRGKLTPYSFVTAADSQTAGLKDNEIVLNQWTADELDAQVGSTVNLKYYEVLPSNKFVEQTRPFTVARIDAMADFATEKALVPEFPGLSNVESCKDWKIGMPMDEALLKDPANEAYWKEFRATPKALITLAAGQALWTNRFGSLTGVRFASEGTNADAVAANLAKELRPRDIGLEVRGVRAAAETAVAQAMDLGGLFLGMSFFLLGAALTLTGLLYAFGAQQRAEEVGVLSALGYTRGRIRNLFLMEASVVALPGALLGAGAGAGYAWALIYALANYWGDVVGRIPILFMATPTSVFVGVVATLICALVTAAITLRRLLRRSINELLHADFTQSFEGHAAGRWALIATALSGLGALALVAAAFFAPPASAAGLFFGSGFLALLSGLLTARVLLSRPASGAAMLSVTSLARLNASRRRGRSLGMIASLSSGAFLVLAVASMQTDMAADADQRSAGTGGFALFAEATVPVLEPATLDTVAPDTHTLGLRVFDGDDASCLNLNHAQRPRVFGVDVTALAELKAFVKGSDEGLWDLLHMDLGEGVYPALVGDSDTAMWTLKKATGVENSDELVYRDEMGRDVRIKLVGKLPMRMSVLSGTVLVATENFTKVWPSNEGFRAFLIDTPMDSRETVSKSLLQKFDRNGLDIQTTVARLEMFHAVEGTYLNMFLVLGGIGMLLGATATGVVVLRNLLERRREIALLRAVGFAPAAVWRLLVVEFGMLLLMGAGIGTVASGVAMLPSLMDAQGGASPVWRIAVLAAVFGSAALCALWALRAGLKNTTTGDLRAE